MPDHVAFLKGMNLGRRRISNEELRGHFADLGLEGVATFRASGNVVFSRPRGCEEGALQRLIEDGLRERLGYEVTTFLRSAQELREIVAREPFDAATRGPLGGKLQVLLLTAPPAAAARRRALAMADARDALALAGSELYWLPEGPMSSSMLDLAELGRLLGPTTIRTMGTLEQIAMRHLAA